MAADFLYFRERICTIYLTGMGEDSLESERGKGIYSLKELNCFLSR